MVRTILENHLKTQAPVIEQDLMSKAGELLAYVSKAQNISVYGLSLLFKVAEGKLIGQVITAQAKEVYCLDAGAFFSEMLTTRLEQAPDLLKKQILAQLGGSKMEALFISMLQKDYMLIRYNRKQKLELHKITSTNSELVNLQDFIKTVKL
ncbi:hypothetical protein [Aureispira anguillae]|uniref:Uncharacterized protein n=1 Tax=Aureispira anguillae TaxID=2864201 RepID=A0A915YHB6_9BACT|nr:hypothetical protein [Aureispira anguillae]BDS13027.1 hypothetical protein AsAng_0037550 [Aureispira anguillae]